MFIGNQIYLRRRQKIILPYPDEVIATLTGPVQELVATFLANLEHLGYTLDKPLVQGLLVQPPDSIISAHDSIVSELQKMIGANVKYKPMYSNFPRQVMKMSEAELYLNAWFHYYGDAVGLRILPVYKKRKRKTLKDKNPLKVIRLGDEKDFERIFTNLLSSKTSISATDKDDLAWFAKEYEYAELIPDEIPFKENAAYFAGMLFKNPNEFLEFSEKHLSTAPDILRLLCAISDGDVSLAENTKFRKLSKKERRLILQLLNSSPNIVEDMLRHSEKWKRVGEILHPFDYRERFPDACKAFDVIRNGLPFSTFNRKQEELIRKNSVDELAQLLSDRPGEYARKIDKLLRMSAMQKPVVDIFGGLVERVATPLLLQLITHFKQRNEQGDMRVFIPKGNAAKVRAMTNNLPRIPLEICEGVIDICRAELKKRFAGLPPIGKTFVDPKLKNYTVPFSLRSASKSLHTISRGSKIALTKGDTIRFFIWWKDGKERTDLDLSAVILDEDHRFQTSIAYFNLKEMGGYHSGDITSAPNGASEFIDINIPKFVKNRSRYVLMSVNSYTEQPFFDLPECFAGFMMRQKPNSGEIYEPRTVFTKFDLTASTQMCIPLIIDLMEREVLWTDIALSRHPSYSNNVFNNMSSITLMNKAMYSLRKPTLFDLFCLHVEARGSYVKSMDEAQTIFSENEGITPKETEQIIAQFL